MEEDTPYTLVNLIKRDDVHSWVVVQDGEFRSYFYDIIEGIVDVRVYRLDSDDTVTYTLSR